MKDYVSIGSAPAEEPCAQVGEPDYPEKSREECRRFIALIRKALGPEKGSARLAVKSFPHDFGTYREVVCYFDDEDEKGADYAFKCESESPGTW